MKKTVCILLLLIAVSQNLFSQKIIRHSLSSIGSSNTINSFHIQQTIGQPSNTTTLYHNSNCVRQGFLQPLQIADKSNIDININLSVFPNPVNDYFNLLINGSDLAFVFKVTDIIGRTILTSEISGNNKLAIRVKGWTKGVYIISIYYGNRFKASGKIIKL
jgi:hypothetical protein